MKSRQGLEWWDVLPLVQDGPHTPQIHWTPLGIITAHPTKPLISLYPHPPVSSDRVLFPLHRPLFPQNEPLGPARVLSVSGSGEYVFAYFPHLVDSTNSGNGPAASTTNAVTAGPSAGSTQSGVIGTYCVWKNAVLKDFGHVSPGESIVSCWWLGDPRQITTDASGRTRRLPPLGPMIAFHSAMALIVFEDFTLQLLCESPTALGMPTNATRSAGTGGFKRLTANVFHKTPKSTPKKPTLGMNLFTGHYCTRAALGLAYNESAIIIAFQASLSPTPRLPASEAQGGTLPIGSTSFLSHSSDHDWELTGPESCIRLCEVKITFTNELGWDLRTEPLSSIPITSSGQLSHLHFIPRQVDEARNEMVVDGTEVDRYLLVGTVDFGSYSGLPETVLSTFALSKKNDPSGRTEWTSTRESTRKFNEHAILAIVNAYPSPSPDSKIVVAAPSGASLAEKQPPHTVRVLKIPSLVDDEMHQVLDLLGPDAPSHIAISPQGTHLALQPMNNFSSLGYHSYPNLASQPKDASGSDTISEQLRDGIYHGVRSSRDIGDIMRLASKMDRVAMLQLVDSIWSQFDQENGGGGAPRWSAEYLKALLILDHLKASESDVGRQAAQQRTKTTLDLLSVPVARSALTECFGKDCEGSYETGAVWPLSEICGWIVEFTESVLLAAGDYHNMAKSDVTSASQEIHPVILIFLHPTFLASWTDAISRTLDFVNHVGVPKGTSTDSKVLVTTNVQDMLGRSPVNFSLLLEKLKSLEETSISPSEWRRSYASHTLPGPLAQRLEDILSRVITAEVVSLLPLHLQLGGLSLVSEGGMRQERDIITKRRLTEGNWPSPLSKLCQRCGGKTLVDLMTPAAPGTRWHSWELSFQRCICGGEWKSL